MYFRRKIDAFLEQWKKDPSHKPLIVKGARQIRKTESILHFSRINYSNIVYEDESKYKLYYPDTGLLVSALDDEAQEDLRANKNLGVYKGALYENFVAEAFTKQGLGLFYYKKENSTLEEDFFVRSKNELIPIEVKSNNKQSKSLNSLIANKNYKDINYGIKLGESNIGYHHNVFTFPFFCAFMIKEYIKH